MKHLTQAHDLWKQHLKEGDFALDLTCGNGHDTLVLATLLPKGIVFGIDLQKEAIAATQERVKGFSNVELFQLSHPALPSLPRSPQLAVYNLGYLPGGDKQITTMATTTVQSLDVVAKILSDQGAISITCYPGHEAGAVEEEAVLSWAASLPSHLWSVCHYRWLNRLKSPSLIWITRGLMSLR